MRINAKTFKNWMKANFTKQEIRDICNYGADAGWHGLTYYRDTCKLYDRFECEIWDRLTDDAESYGHKNVFEMIANFRRADVMDSYQFKNLLAWYMAEEIARELTDRE